MLTVALIYYYLVSFASEKSITRKIAGIVLIVIVFYGGTMLFEGIQSSFNLNWLARLLSLQSDRGSTRLDIWGNVWLALRNQNIINWLIGHGYRTTVIFGGAHNDFLELLYDFGIVGFAVYLSLIIELIKYSFKMKKCKYEYHHQYNVSLILFLIYSMIGQLIYLPQAFLILAAFWGMIMSHFENRCAMNYIQ